MLTWLLIAFPLTGAPTTIERFPDKGSCITAQGTMEVFDVAITRNLLAQQRGITRGGISYICLDITRLPTPEELPKH